VRIGEKCKVNNHFILSVFYKIERALNQAFYSVV